MARLLLLRCLLLASGVFLSILAGHLRMFEFPGNRADRDGAFRTCKSRQMNLVTVYDKDDAKVVTSFIKDKCCIWVGLQRNNNIKDEPVPLCNAIVNASLERKNCSDSLRFMCQRGQSVVEHTMNWCLAKLHCREHGLGDLVSDENLTEIMKAGNGSGPFWIGGAMTDGWTWNDSSCSTFRDWDKTANFETKSVAYMKDHKLFPFNSDSYTSTLCSKGDVRIVVVDRNATWEQALHHCDTRHSGLLQIVTQDDQKAVEQWLNRTGRTGAFWVGLRQSRVFGFWIWKDRMVDFSRWENGTHPEMPLSQQCGVIQTNNYTWRDHNCLHALPFICEEAIVRLR